MKWIGPILAAALTSMPAAAQEAISCADLFANASAHYRDALYQSTPGHRDVPATKEALEAFRAAWSTFAERRRDDCPPAVPPAERWRLLSAVADIAGKAAADTARGRLEQAHQGLMQIRSLLGELRGFARHAFYDDRLDAYDDKLAEAEDDELDEEEISPDQFVQLCEQVGVLAYLGEKLEKNAPPQWAADPAFLDALETLNHRLRGVKAALLKGQSAQVHAALSDLRLDFDHFYLLYG